MLGHFLEEIVVAYVRCDSISVPKKAPFAFSFFKHRRDDNYRHAVIWLLPVFRLLWGDQFWQITKRGKLIPCDRNNWFIGCFGQTKVDSAHGGVALDHTKELANGTADPWISVNALYCLSSIFREDYLFVSILDYIETVVNNDLY